MITQDEGKEILIPGPISFIMVHLEYCLGRPATFKLRPDDPQGGFTRAELAQSICTMYQRVYKVEHETAGISDVAPRMGAIMINRGQTFGKVRPLSCRVCKEALTRPLLQYHISMHDLEDLVLHTGYYDEEKKSMRLGIDS